MTESRIIPVVMPKWGLSMKEGKLTGWLMEDGKQIRAGDAILEVETDKIAGTVESAEAGILRRRIGEADTIYPVKALLGVIADATVADADIEAYVASYVTPAADEEAEDAAVPQYEFVDVAQGKLRYAKRGEGSETVILIHGFGGDLDNWLFNIDALAEVANVYALDLPGHGRSVKSIGDPSVAGLARTVVSFMDALGIGSAHLVGHSLGGAIAMEMAGSAKDRVRSLTLIASAGLGSEINMEYISGFLGASSRRELKPVLEQLFGDASLVSRQMIDDILKFKRLDGVGEALQALADGTFKAGRQQAIFQPAGTPTLAITGKEDRIIPSFHTAKAKGARIEIIEGAGHMVQMEQASKVNALIKAQIAA